MGIIIDCPHCLKPNVVNVWDDLKIKKRVTCDYCYEWFIIRLEHLTWIPSKGGKRKDIDLNQSF